MKTEKFIMKISNISHFRRINKFHIWSVCGEALEIETKLNFSILGKLQWRECSRDVAAFFLMPLSKCERHKEQHFKTANFPLTNVAQIFVFVENISGRVRLGLYIVGTFNDQNPSM